MNRMPRTYSFIDFPPLTEEQKTEISELSKMKDSEIDTSDIPENTLSNGQFYSSGGFNTPPLWGETKGIKSDCNTL